MTRSVPQGLPDCPAYSLSLAASAPLLSRLDRYGAVAMGALDKAKQALGR